MVSKLTSVSLAGCIWILAVGRPRVRTCSKIMPGVIVGRGASPAVGALGRSEEHCAETGIQMPPSGRAHSVQALLDGSPHESAAVQSTSEDVAYRRAQVGNHL